MDLTITLNICRNKKGEWSQEQDLVIREVPVTLYVNEQELVTMLATPQYLDELAVGYLLAEGFLSKACEVASIDIDPDGNWVKVSTATETERGWQLYGRRMLTSGCGRGSIFYQSLDALDASVVTSDFTLRPECINALVRSMEDSSLLFQETGGVHVGALANEQGILLFREDIGRHNAVDKIAGYCLLHGINCQDKILLTSGRISSEMIIKAAKLGVPIIISPSAPTDLAVQIAHRLCLTLVGFARGNRFNIYSEAWRIRKTDKK
ncbi:MAG: formate dehydrogenase accessory sulfurtransferase FdhD [bacterium]|jgi:FdhD protein